MQIFCQFTLLSTDSTCLYCTPYIFIKIYRRNILGNVFSPKRIQMCTFFSGKSLLLLRVCIALFEVCSGSVVVTAFDFESDRPGSNPEWGLIAIYYKASITAQGLPEPASLLGSIHWVPCKAVERIGCNWGMQDD